MNPQKETANEMFHVGEGKSIYAPAWYVARDTWVRANIPPEWRDEDAVQEAAAAFVEAEGMPKSWAFRRAKWRVLGYLFRYHRNDNTHRPGAHARGEVERVSFADDPEDSFRRLASPSADPEQIMIGREEAAERTAVLQESARVFYRILLDSRSKKGRRGKQAAAREANILVLRLAGYSNAGIANELGIAAKDVEYYLRGARRRLVDYINRMEVRNVKFDSDM